jgi:hypothetical protein
MIIHSIMNKNEVIPLDEHEPNLYDINAGNPRVTDLSDSEFLQRRDSIDGILKEMEEERQAEINKMRYTAQ